MTSPLTTVRPFYVRGDSNVSDLFGSIDGTYERKHLAVFARHHRLELGDALEIAMELPEGAFLAGGFMRSVITNQPIKDFDLFFSSEAAFKNMIKRIHEAPEGTYLRGYESDLSLRELIQDPQKNRKYLMFTCEGKPPIQLIRTRWYERSEEIIDKFDMTISQFAVDSELNITYSARALEDIRNRYVRLWKVIFPTSTGLRIRRFLDQGFRWTSDNYGSGDRDTYLQMASKWMTRVKKAAEVAGQPIPENMEGFGSFEV